MRLLGLVCLLSACVAASCTGYRSDREVRLYDVSVESGARQALTGASVAYDLFIPRPTAGLPGPPFPAVILTHGFARDRTFHRNNALYMAQRGIVVLTPDMISLLGGATSQSANIAILSDHVRWLTERSSAAGDPLVGILDARRIGLAGHSAGGAVSLEAAVKTQEGPASVAAVCLLDAVPWDRTLERAADLRPMPLASIRSEPGPWNLNGRALDLLNRLTFDVEDVRVVGSTHCDPENPTDLLGQIACGLSTEERRAIYQRLMYLFFRDALKSHRLALDGETYAHALQRLQATGLISRSADRPFRATSASEPVRAAPASDPPPARPENSVRGLEGDGCQRALSATTR
jgi:pimeloyl-ACP methyl ester carboxylesterase